MTIGNALFKLVEALAKADYQDEMLDIKHDEGVGITVTLLVPVNGVEIQVGITDSRALFNYYVNYHAFGGDFAHYAGTPFIEKALVNIGACINTANNHALKGGK